MTVPPTPVFILGITQRSGTNLLYRALLEHPDCVPARQPGEDFLVHGVDHLRRYVDSVAAQWNPEWDLAGERAADLARALGRGWLAHLRPEGGAAAFVTKTPSVRGIAHVHRFLPEARVLALVRDGRDVAESGVRSFGWTYGEAFRRCLASVTAASPAAAEIIVVADGCTDDSMAVAESFGATVVRIGGPAGPARARNIGAERATGAILFFIDADVEIPPDGIALVAAVFDVEPDVAAIIGFYD